MVYETSTFVDISCSKFFIVNSGQNENLADFVRRIRNEKRLSVAEVAVKSGNRISGAYVNKIENDIHGTIAPSMVKLEALAAGLGVSTNELFAVSTGKNLNEKAVLEEGLARGLERLSPNKRRLAVKQMNGILESLADSDDDFDYGDFDTKQ